MWGQKMGYKIYKKDNEIHILVDSKNDGKLRFKKRKMFSVSEKVFRQETNHSRRKLTWSGK